MDREMRHKNGLSKYKITNPKSYTSSPAAASSSPFTFLASSSFLSSHFLPPFSCLVNQHRQALRQEVVILPVTSKDEPHQQVLYPSTKQHPTTSLPELFFVFRFSQFSDFSEFSMGFQEKSSKFPQKGKSLSLEVVPFRIIP